jgi:hypothetical protein
MLHILFVSFTVQLVRMFCEIQGMWQETLAALEYEAPSPRI